MSTPIPRYTAAPAKPSPVKFIVAAAMLAIVVVGLGLWYQGRQQIGLSEKLSGIEFLNEHADSIRARYSEVRQQWESASRRHEQYALLTDKPLNESDFLGHLTRLAAPAGLEIRDYRTSFALESGLDVTLSASGSFASIARFLDGLEKSPTPCRIAQCDITPASGEGQACSLQLRLHL